MGQYHNDSARGEARTDTTSSGLKYPSRGSPARTNELVAAHFRICRADNSGVETREPASAREKYFATGVRREFQSLMHDLANSWRFKPARIFVHSERIIPANGERPMAINFLAEARNHLGDFIVLSHLGWSLHSHSCPAFMHVQASLAEPGVFDALKLYTRDSFGEEVSMISSNGMKLLLGLRCRSYILEESLTAIAHLCGGKPLEPSGVSRIEVASCSDYHAVLKLKSPAVGKFDVSVNLVTRHWCLTVSACKA